MGEGVESFAALWTNFLSFIEKNHPILCIPIFDNFPQFLIIKKAS